ncbi:hypothetical protein SAMN02745866_03795 [Alteromonadaceae bacterium Bs31]|nr:hypothetical protein SAMN02745866_03795 [Alteromonadaceae bacterium Bs31]
MFPNERVLSSLSNADNAEGMRNTGELGKALFSQGILQYKFRQHKKVKAITLVVAGKMDYQIGLAPQKALAEQLPKASIALYENSGHFMFLDEPVKFETDIITFFSL